MSSVSTFLCAPAYALGEQTHPYTRLPDVTAKCREFGMPELPSLWGWGHYHATGATLYEMASSSIAKTLVAAPDVGRIDHLIFCSSEISSAPYGGFHPANDALQQMLHAHGLEDVSVTGVSLCGCNSLINALMWGRALLRSGEAHAVLVVASEKARSESYRFDRHCIFSDAASSLLLTTEDHGGLELLDVKCLLSPPAAQHRGHVFRGDLERAQAAYRALLASRQLAAEQLSLVIGPNYYPPLFKTMLTAMGMSGLRSFAGDVTGHGHCFSSDYIINLVDYLQEGQAAAEEQLLLFAHSDLHYGFSLLRRPAPCQTAAYSGAAHPAPRRL
jgi:3-oxoacyl-[acyl-carrier-protein] synthase-3